MEEEKKIEEELETQTTFEEQSIEEFEDLSGGDIDEATDNIAIEE